MVTRPLKFANSFPEIDLGLQRRNDINTTQTQALCYVDKLFINLDRWPASILTHRT